MTLYYAKQDNTIWGCGDPECCGSYYEEIDEIFVDVDEEDVTYIGSLESRILMEVGGGEILEVREATPTENRAYYAGVSVGFTHGAEYSAPDSNRLFN